jgi:homoserine kinase
VVSEAPVSDAWRALVGRRVTVEAPASSANLGAGYDCLGLALDLVNRVTVEARDDGRAIELAVEGEGAGELPATRENRFVAGLESALEGMLGPVPGWLGWRIRMENRAPLSRGLGSSAAATVAGVVAGTALACEVRPEMERSVTRQLALATRIERHPDNAAAVLLGGFVVSAAIGDRVEAVRFDAPSTLRAVLFIPELRLSTEAMRRVLPASVPLADAVANLGRVAVGVAGIASGRMDLLRDLTVDRIHEPYRAAAFPQLPALTAAAREAGAIGAFLSGAGSTICAFSDSDAGAASVADAMTSLAASLGLAGRSAVARPRNRGAEVVEGT